MLLAEALGIPTKALKDPERYEVSAILAEGGMGRVLLGTDTRLRREIAIKVILPEKSSTVLAERFYREAQAVAMLDHPSIVRVYDYSGPQSSVQFMVMERLRGVDLQTLIDQNALSESVTLAIAYELGRAFSHLHDAGLIHRDVKPSNIMIEPNGRVVLVDFGLVKGIQAEGGRQTFVASRTRIVGTAVFMSPEQLRGEPLDARSDLFSLGGVLYVALSQVFPFDAPSLLEVSRHILAGTRHRIDALIDLHDDTTAIVEKLLSVRPQDRFQTAASLCEAIGPQLQRLGVFSPQQTVADWAKSIDLNALRKEPSTDLRGMTFDAGLTSSGDQGLRSDTQITARSETQIVTVGDTQVSTARGIVTNVDRAPLRRMTRAVVFSLIAALLIILAGAVVAFRPAAGVVEPKAALGVARPVEHPVAVEVANAVDAPLPTPAASVVVPDPAPKKKELFSKVSFNVQPWGDVTVDGKMLGTTPALRDARLSFGAHTVVVYHPKFGTKKITVIVSKAEQEIEVILAR